MACSSMNAKVRNIKFRWWCSIVNTDVYRLRRSAHGDYIRFSIRFMGYAVISGAKTPFTNFLDTLALIMGHR
jgi:hypothetical protein